MPLRGRTAIVGIGETPYVRKSGKDVKRLVLEAVDKALDDAGLRPTDIDGIVTEGGVMPILFSHDEMAQYLGISRSYSATVSFTGSGIAATPLTAAMAIESGAANVVLSYFGVDWGSSQGSAYGFHDIYPAKRVFEVPHGFHGQPTYFAMVARHHMHKYGLTERQLASLAVMQRQHSILNGRGQVMTPLTIEDCLKQSLVADPLRVTDCCLLTDGAGAFIMTSAERARDCRAHPVSVLGCAYAASPVSVANFVTQDPGMLMGLPCATEATNRALRMADLSLSDIDFAEIYDCFTISALLQIEAVGFCRVGEGGAFIEAGNGCLGSKLPINTHGGFLSHGYMMLVDHVIEAVRQLRHDAGQAQVENAEIGFIGGLSADYGALILGRTA